MTTEHTPTTEAGRQVLAGLERLDAARPDIAKEAPIDWASALWAVEAQARAESRAEGLDVTRLAHKAAEIGFTYGALGRDYEYVLKNVNDMLRAALEEPTDD